MMNRFKITHKEDCILYHFSYFTVWTFFRFASPMVSQWYACKSTLFFLQIIGILKSFFFYVVFLIHIFTVFCAFGDGSVGGLSHVLLRSWGYRVI